MTKYKYSFRYLILYFIMLGFVCACSSSKYLSKEEYRSWLRSSADSVLSRKGELNSIGFKSVYYPTELMKLGVDTVEGVSQTKDEVKEQRNVFLFSIHAPNNGETLKYDLRSNEEYYERLKYYSFNANSDFFLATSKDTIQASDVNLIRSYGVKPQLELQVLFESLINKKEGMTLIYYDRIYTDEWMYFRYDKSTLKDIPKLKS